MNNLIYMESQGDVLETLLENQDNEYVVSNNLFYPSSRIDLDEDLGQSAFLVNPLVVEPSELYPLQSALGFQLQPNSPALDNGVPIVGSNNPLEFLMNNGGQDFFGQALPPASPLPLGPSVFRLWSRKRMECV